GGRGIVIKYAARRLDCRADRDPHRAAVSGAEHRSDCAAHPAAGLAAAVSDVAVSASGLDRSGQLYVHPDFAEEFSARDSLRGSDSGCGLGDLSGAGLAAAGVAV